jgi:SAM-dependent methyltransferase
MLTCQGVARERLDRGTRRASLESDASRIRPPEGEVCGINVGVIEALPYPDDHFDGVLSSLMLHHLPDGLKRRGLAEIHRVLQAGGRFAAIDFGATQSMALRISSACCACGPGGAMPSGFERFFVEPDSMRWRWGLPDIEDWRSCGVENHAEAQAEASQPNSRENTRRGIGYAAL